MLSPPLDATQSWACWSHAIPRWTSMGGGLRRRDRLTGGCLRPGVTAVSPPAWGSHVRGGGRPRGVLGVRRGRGVQPEGGAASREWSWRPCGSLQGGVRTAPRVCRVASNSAALRGGVSSQRTVHVAFPVRSQSPAPSGWPSWVLRVVPSPASDRARTPPRTPVPATPPLAKPGSCLLWSRHALWWKVLEAGARRSPAVELGPGRWRPWPCAPSPAAPALTGSVTGLRWQLSVPVVTSVSARAVRKGLVFLF